LFVSAGNLLLHFANSIEADKFYRKKIRKKVSRQTQNTTRSNSCSGVHTYTEGHIMEVASHYLPTLYPKVPNPQQNRQTFRSFCFLTPQLANPHITPITVNIGDAATIIDNYRSDIAFCCAHSCRLAPIDPAECGLRLLMGWAELKTRFDNR
jgi:hypothetical protein